MRTWIFILLLAMLFVQPARAQEVPDTAKTETPATETQVDTAKMAPPEPLPVHTAEPTEVTPAAKEEKVKRNILYLSGGIATPMSPDEFKDTWKMGYGGGVGGGYLFSPNVEIVAWIYYNSFSLDVPSGVTATGGTFSSIEFMFDLKYIFVSKAHPAKAKPYLVGGLGTTAANISEANIMAMVVQEAKESALTFNFGGGFEVELSTTAGLFVEVMYTSISTEGGSTAYLPIRGGLKLALY